MTSGNDRSKESFWRLGPCRLRPGQILEQWAINERVVVAVDGHEVCSDCLHEKRKKRSGSTAGLGDGGAQSRLLQAPVG